jgi:PAS domain S-box-containing protein
VFYEDISESHRLEKMRSLLAAIVESSEDAIVGIDLGGNIVSWNKGAEMLYGYTEDEAVGHSRSLLVPPGQSGDTTSVLDRIRQNEKVDRFETIHLRKDGTAIDVSVTISPILDEQGVVLGASTISRNISERKGSERALQASHQKLMEIIDFLPDATFVIDHEKTVIAWNSAIEHLTGVKKEEMLGKGNQDYSIPFYGRKRACLLDLLFTREEELEQHYPVVGREGDSLHCEVFSQHLFGGRGAYLWVKASPLYDAEGSVAGAVETIRDITERKRMEEDLRERELRFRRVAEFSPFPILIVDPDDNLRYVNDRFTELFGYTPDMLVSLEGWLAAAFPDDTYRAWAGRIWREELRASLGYLNTGPVFSIHTTSGGQRSVIIHPVSLDDGSSYVWFEDITEQKQTRDREQRYTRNLELLSKTATDLAHLRSGGDLYEYIGDQLGVFAPEGLVVVLSSKENTSDLRVQAVRGQREMLTAAEAALGRPMKGMEVSLAEDAVQYLRMGRKHRVSGGCETVLRRILPGADASKVAESFGKGECYVMGFVDEELLLGGIGICQPEGKELPNEAVIETFVNQASVALFRHRAEEQRVEANRELEEQLLEHTRALSNANTMINLESIERKYLMRSLKKQGALLFSLLNSLNMVIVAADLHGRIIMINERARELFQHTFEEVAGMPWYDLVASASFRREAEALNAKVLEGESAADVLLRRVVNGNGEEKDLVLHLKGACDEQGAITGIYLFGEEPPGRNVILLSKYLSGAIILPPSR